MSKRPMTMAGALEKAAEKSAAFDDKRHKQMTQRLSQSQARERQRLDRERSRETGQLVAGQRKAASMSGRSVSAMMSGNDSANALGGMLNIFLVYLADKEQVGAFRAQKEQCAATFRMRSEKLGMTHEAQRAEIRAEFIKPGIDREAVHPALMALTDEQLVYLRDKIDPDSPDQTLGTGFVKFTDEFYKKGYDAYVTKCDDAGKPAVDSDVWLTTKYGEELPASYELPVELTPAQRAEASVVRGVNAEEVTRAQAVLDHEYYRGLNATVSEAHEAHVMGISYDHTIERAEKVLAGVGTGAVAEPVLDEAVPEDQPATEPAEGPADPSAVALDDLLQGGTDDAQRRGQVRRAAMASMTAENAAATVSDASVTRDSKQAAGVER